MHIRALKTGDETKLEHFLSGHAETSMFLRSNARKAGLLYKDEAFHGDYLGAFDNDGALQGVLAHYWNGNVMMQTPDENVLQSLCAHFTGIAKRPVCGVIGPNDQCVATMRLLGIDKMPYAMNGDEDLYILNLDDLAIPAAYDPAQHTLVPARELGKDLLTAWLRAYNIEALGSGNDEKLDKRIIRDVQMTISENRRWGLLHNGKPVALSGFNAALPDIVQIGPVWTPPEHRSNGFGRMVVALSLKQARENGVEKSVLFTNNPPAARAYEAIGYEKTGKFRIALLKNDVTFNEKKAAL